MPMKRLLITLATLSMLGFTGAAHAEEGDTAAQAKAAFKAGQEFFKAGDYVEALRAFKKANKLHPHPDILFMVGQSQRNLKVHASAIASFKAYLDGKPEAEDREDVERLIEELEFLDEAEGSAVDPTLKDEEEAERQAEAARLAAVEKKRKAAAAKKKTLPRHRRQDAPHALTPGKKKDSPVYKQWWFWAAIGGGLAVVGGTIGIVAWQTSGTDAPEGSLGTFDIP